MMKIKRLSLISAVAAIMTLGAGCSEAAKAPQPVANAPTVSAATIQTPAKQAPATAAPAVVTPPPAALVKPTPAKTAAYVKIANFSFQPSQLSVVAGVPVTWINNDSAPHTVSADDNSFDSELIVPGGTFSRTFTSSFTYHCSIHPNMKGGVKVK